MLDSGLLNLLLSRLNHSFVSNLDLLLLDGAYLGEHKVAALSLVQLGDHVNSFQAIKESRAVFPTFSRG